MLVGLEPLVSPAHLLGSGSADPTGPDGSRKTKGEEGRGLIHIFQENKKERKGKGSKREKCAFFVVVQGSLDHALKLSRQVRKVDPGRVTLDITPSRNSAVFLPGFTPGMKPLFFLISSAIIVGLIVTAV